MNCTKHSKKAKTMAVFFVFVLILSMMSPVTERVSSAEKEELEADAEAGSWEELVEIFEELEEEEYVIELTKDITAGEDMDAIIISDGQDITIDLAGHVMDRGLGDEDLTEDGYVILVEEGGKLTLTDTTEKTGLITGGANAGNGGGILCEDGSELTVTGGVKINENRAKNGAGICLGNDCELYLGDCTISGNDASRSGGGISGGGSHITFLGGVTKVKDNYKGGDEENANDLYIPAEMEKLRFYTVNEKGKTKASDAFQRGTKIGILLEEMSKEISDGYGQSNSDEASLYFFYDSSDYVISDDRKKSEITIVKEEESLHDNTKTVLEIYSKGKLKASKQYDSFAEALSEGISSGGEEKVVILGGDYSSDEEIVLEKSKAIIIDLNGHYIKRDRNGKTKKNGGVFHVKSEATLTIRDSHPKKKGYDGVKGGVITGGASSNGGGGITIDEKGHLVMEGGTIYNCISDYSGGGVYVDTGSKSTSFKMTGGRIYNCKTSESTDECYGGGIYFGDGILDLQGGTVEGCYSEDDGGAIYCKRGEVKLSDMKFSGNTSWNRGGAIYIGLDYAKYDGTLFYAKGCTFSDNISHEDGGAFFMRDNPAHMGSITFDRCVFKKNSAEEDGGAIVAFDDGLVLSNVEITENSAGGYGGGVFVDSRYDINLKGIVVIKDNTCKKDKACADLCLESGTSTTAYVNSGGLIRGSWIGIGSTSGKSIRLSKKMTVYEMKYFHPGAGKIDAKKVERIKVDMAVTASIFGNGRLTSIFLIGSAGIIVLLILAVFAYRKQKAGFKTGGGL